MRYVLDPSPKKEVARKHSKLRYKVNPLVKRAASISYYSKRRLLILTRSRNYYTANKEFVCFLRRVRYVLSEPRMIIKLAYIKQLQRRLLDDQYLKAKLCKQFAKAHEKVGGGMTANTASQTVCQIAAQQMVSFLLSCGKTLRACFSVVFAW